MKVAGAHAHCSRGTSPGLRLLVTVLWWIAKEVHSAELAIMQKRALRIIYPDLSYAEALVAAGITSLYERRQVLSETLFDQIMQDPSHKLHDLLPPRNESTYCTRSRRYFELPICKTHRFRKTFIMNHSFNYN